MNNHESKGGRAKSKNNPTALNKAVEYLSRQAYSERKLREKLRLKSYDSEEIEAAIARLKEKNYLDDEDTARHQFDILYQDSKKSIRQILLKLRERGFPSHIISRLVPKDNYARELNAAKKNLAIKYSPDADSKKMTQYLYQKGFSYDIAKEATLEYQDEYEEELE